jgi:hypothetical protein
LCSWLLSLASSLWCGGGSPIQEDERVVFFPTLGRLSEDESIWTLDIHGWIFEPEEDSFIRAEVRDLFRSVARLEPNGAVEDATFHRRASAFLVDNERGKEISIRIGDKVHGLEESGPNGHFIGSVRIVREEVDRLVRAPGAPRGRLTFRAVTRDGDRREFAGEVFLVDATGLSVVSDIDDTIKVSNVLDRSMLLENTFCGEFRDVAGMAAVYRQLARKGAAFHYVSAGPWQLYEPLAEFVKAKNFPAGSFHMRQFRIKDTSILQVFESPEEYKVGVIDSLLAAFPKRRFLLVGDSGEKDPEAYGAVARKRPDQVERIWIRDVTGEDAGKERYRRAFEGLPEAKWRIFKESEDILLVR